MRFVIVRPAIASEQQEQTPIAPTSALRGTGPQRCRQRLVTRRPRAVMVRAAMKIEEPTGTATSHVIRLLEMVHGASPSSPLIYDGLTGG